MRKKIDEGGNSYLSEQNDANNDSSKSRANARAPKTGSRNGSGRELEKAREVEG